MWTQIGTVLLLVVLWFGAYVLRRMREYKRVAEVLKSQFPSVPRDSFVLGNASNKAFGSPQMHRWLAETSLKYGKTFVLRIASRPVVMTCCPKLITAIHDRSLYPEYLDKPKYQEAFNIIQPDPKVNTIMSATCCDPLWKLVRKGVSPAFNPANLRAEFPATVESALHLVEAFHRLGPDTPIDVDKAAQRQSMDVIGRVGFGTEFHATDSVSGQPGEVDVVDLLGQGTVEITRRLRNPWRDLLFFTKEYRETYRKIRILRKKMCDMVKEVKARGLAGVPPHTIAGHLMRLKDPHNPTQPLPHNIFTANSTLFFGAGVDTSGHTIAWTLYFISQLPEVEKKIVAELDAAELLVTPARPHPRRMVYQDLSHLPYLTWVFKESMRFFPTVGGAFPREVKRDLHLGPFFFPKGTVIFAAVYATHHHPDNWENPEEFIPERWAVDGAEYVPVGGVPHAAEKGDAVSGQEASTASPPPATGTSHVTNGHHESEDHGRPLRYIPFGAGPRQCIGLSLAKQNIITTLAHLLSHFTFKLADQMGEPTG